MCIGLNLRDLLNPDIRGGGLSASASVSINGLTGGIAIIGDHASLTLVMSDASTILSQTWGSTPGGTQYGTGTSPTDYTGGDGGTLHVTATTAAGTVSRSASIRYAVAVNTVAPVASGSTSLGDTLTTTNGTWTGAVGGSFTYQWQRDGANIAGATSSTYDIVAADDAADVRCVVTYTNSGGAVSANSNAITVADFTSPAISGAPTIAGTTTEGQTLTATAASVTGDPTPTRTWQWERGGVAISGATSSTYALVLADVGETITVVQTETNDLGADTAESAATATIIAAPSIPDLSALSVSTQETDGDVPLSYTLDTDTTVYFVGSTSATQPTAAQIIAGNDHTGSSAAFDFSAALTTSGIPINATVPADLSDDYHIHAVVSAGADGDVITASGSPVNIKTTLPVLSSATSSALAETTATITVTSDTAAGTLYAGVWPSASTPSDADIVAGTGATFHTSTASPLAAANNFSATGLTASTSYKAHFIQRDAVSNQSTSPEASFSTTAASSFAFEDDFTRGADEDLSAGTEWENQSGTTGDHAVIASSDTLETQAGACLDTVTTAAYSSAADTAVSVDFGTKSGAGESLTGLVIRCSSGTTGYGLNIDPDQNGGDGMIRILDLADFGAVGTATTFTAEGVSLPFTATLKADGSTISAEIDGVEVISGTDTTHTSGQPGIWTLYQDGTAVQSLDNFTVEEI